MNKFFKVIVAILGGFNAAFSIFTPIAIALLLISTQGWIGDWSNFLLIVGLLSSLYRAIDIGFITKS